MPATAYAVIALFSAVSLLSGLVAGRVVGPRQPWTPVLPALAAFAALYLVGHRLAISIGPTVRLFGFELSLLFDVAAALAASMAAAMLQAGVLRLFQSEQRRAGGDRLA